ncbi:MAG: VWA domain-containing protein [Sedimentisphaerales bacterium]|nr:VWA domain-containing protein [Sedimentisphaerales bacterium]
MQLYSSWILLLLLIIPVLGWLGFRKKNTAAVTFSSLNAVQNCPVSLRLRLRPLLVFARLACLALLIIALARPRKGTVLSEISAEGVAIEIVVDHSGSMGAEMDYYGEKLNRLEALKKVLADFVIGGKGGLAGRSGDLLGLVTFARYPDTVCPLVLGHNVLLEFLKTTDIVRLRSEDGTAIGDALALAASRLHKAEEELKQRKAGIGSEKAGVSQKDDFKIKSKAIILLTDGRHNAGQYGPMQAAGLAKKWDIKIYTVGIGSGQAFTTIQTMMGAFKIPTEQDLDEPLLRAIAETTGGFYGRADDAEALHEIMEKIDKLEKTEVRAVQYTQYAEKFGPWTFTALAFLLAEILAGCTILRKIP